MLDEGEEPDCDSCHVELDAENYTTWRLYSLCRGQALRAGMDGTVVGIDAVAVIEILKLYGEYNVGMFENMLFCWRIEQGDS